VGAQKTLAAGLGKPYAVTEHMGFSGWIHGLWLAGLFLQPLLLALLALRGMWKKFPLFTAYLACSMLGDAIGYALSRNRDAYVHLYLIDEAISVILALGVTYEIFTQLFLSYPALRRLASLTIRVVAGVLISLGAVVIYTHLPIGEKGLASAVLVVEEASRIVEVGLIMSLFLFSRAFGLHWRQHVFGIVLGLGISAAVRLAAVTIVPHSATAAGALTVAVMLSFDFSLLIWLGYLLAPERVTSVAELPKRAQLEQWNRAIMELINQ
jgi:hypothetical protein